MTALVIEDPKFLKGQLIRVDVSVGTLKRLNLRIPTGNEVGANKSFRLGAETIGDISEGVVKRYT